MAPLFTEQLCSMEFLENCTQRVLAAIRSLKAQFVYWPNPAERTSISKRMAREHGLPVTVGIVDGTPINFVNRDQQLMEECTFQKF